MSRMSDNDEFSGRNFGDSLQLTNWVLDSRASCHMTLQVSYFIPVSLDDSDQDIEVADGHLVMAKKRRVGIKMCNNNGDTFITTLHKVFFGTRSMKHVPFNFHIN